MTDGFNSVSLKSALTDKIDQMIEQSGLWTSRADFVADAVRRRLDELDGQPERITETP